VAHVDVTVACLDRSPPTLRERPRLRALWLAFAVVATANAGSTCVSEVARFVPSDRDRKLPGLRARGRQRPVAQRLTGEIGSEQFANLLASVAP
jgi:hypothetical protein